MKIRNFLFLLLLCFLYKHSFVLAEEEKLTSPPLQTINLQLQWKHQFQFAGYYAAIAKGYYEDVGLKVNLLEPPEKLTPVENVIRGKAEFGVSTSDLLLWRAQGRPVVILGTIYQHSPFIFLTLKKSGIDNIHELVGKKVMIEPHAAELLAYFQQEQIPLHKLIQIPHSFDTNALIKGEIDGMSAYSTDEPFLLKKAGLEYQIFNPRAGGIDFYGDTLFTTEIYLKKHPEIVAKFREASFKGWEYALDHPEEIIDLILTKYSQRHSREHLQFEAQQVERLILPNVIEIGYINKGRWEHIRDTYAQLNMIPANFTLKGFLYNDYTWVDFTQNSKIFWLYIFLGSSIFILVIVSLIATRFYKLNQVVRQEMKEKELITTELKLLEKRYRLLSENAPFPIVITTIADGKVCYINQQASQQFQIDTAEALNNFAHQFYVNPQERKQFIQILEKQNFIDNYEIELKTAKGLSFWASISANIIEFDGDSAIFVALINITERKKLEEKLHLMAMTDELTKIYNRRYFMIKGLEELNRAKRYQTPFSLLMIDVDFFKNINDNYGHDVGDQVLKHLTNTLKNNLRNIDILGRLGGEEFGILLPNTASASALILAQRLCQMIEVNPLSIQEQILTITISMGVAHFSSDITDLDELLKRADLALYQAKNQGRNCVIVFDY